jgi:TfoX N-terminal domain
MSTSPETIEMLIDSLEALPNVSYRKMFGEYALYCDTKVVALVCDDQLFIKLHTLVQNSTSRFRKINGGQTTWLNLSEQPQMSFHFLDLKRKSFVDLKK